MTNGQSLVDGRAGDDEIHWLARRADGGFGCVATCAAYVSRDGKAWDGQLGIDRDDELEGLAGFAERVQRGGSTGMVQLFHGGVRATQRLTGEQVWSATTFHEDGKDFEMAVDGRVVANDAAIIVRAALGGLGLAYMMESTVRPLLADRQAPAPRSKTISASQQGSPVSVSRAAPICRH